MSHAIRPRRGFDRKRQRSAFGDRPAGKLARKITSRGTRRGFLAFRPIRRKRSPRSSSPYGNPRGDITRTEPFIRAAATNYRLPCTTPRPGIVPRAGSLFSRTESRGIFGAGFHGIGTRPRADYRRRAAEQESREATRRGTTGTVQKEIDPLPCRFVLIAFGNSSFGIPSRSEFLFHNNAVAPRTWPGSGRANGGEASRDMFLLLEEAVRERVLRALREMKSKAFCSFTQAPLGMLEAEADLRRGHGCSRIYRGSRESGTRALEA